MDSTGDQTPLIEMRDIHKTYASNGVHACRGMHIRIQQGTTHIIAGENGAGKSTIMKILSGDITPDAGSIWFKGRKVNFRHPEDALDQGIGMIHQILHYFPTLTVREHMMIGMKSLPLYARIRPEAIDAHITEIADHYHMYCNPHERVDHMSAEARQITAILSLISRGTELFILDEPPQKVLEAAMMLKQEGKTIIIITHNIKDALAYGDQITVLRGGANQGTFPASGLTRDELSDLIMGEHVKRQEGHRPSNHESPVDRSGEPLIRISALSGGDLQSQDQIHDVSLSVYPGETVAVVGIKDNGLRAMEALVTGKTRHRFIPLSGSVRIRDRSPRQCSSQVLGYIPSDRLETGSSVTMSVTDNIMINMRNDTRCLSTWSLPGGRPLLLPIFSRRALRELTERIISAFRITGKGDHPLESLSGGNIQKLITARALYQDPEVLVCADISWGLDVKTRETLFEAIDQHKRRGMAVLFFTSEVSTALDEADRIAILRHGRLTAVLDNHRDLTAKDIGGLML
ncbi:MAG: ATP-binding cassette domain-containing protein [Spirochaetia bacterium]|nr:ATP-binding cassette domain-containing protein [Spirochaetia bacterium]MCF7941752.1 ATP-binding cassette domain-containing protein [Spirochaetia bacterium]